MAGSPESTKESLRSVLTNPNLRRIQLAWAGSLTGDWAYGTAITVWAYQQGGATAVGVFSAVRFVIATFAGPIGASIADRMSRRRYMITLDLIRAVLVSITATIVMLDGPAAGVYVMAGLTAMVGASFRSAQAGLVPKLVETPGELTASNAVAANIENVVTFMGPAIGALMIARFDVAPVVWLNAVTFVWSFVMVMGVRVPAGRSDAPEPRPEGEAEEGTLRQMTAGFRVLGRDADLRAIALLTASQTLIWGLLTVFTVVIAVRDFGQASSVGWLQGSMGVGTLVGGALVLTRVSKGKLATDMVIGVLGWSLPLFVLAAFPSPVTSVAALIVIGIADPWVNLGLETIPQRLAPERIISRVYAAVESVAIGGIALGAAVSPLLLHAFGVRGTLLGAGVLVTAYAASTLPRMRGLDQRLTEPAGLPLLRRISMFEPVQPSVLEEMAHRLESVSFAAGDVVVREGDPSDRFYVIAEGEVEVSHGVQVIRREGPGDFFGEIGLLRDVPRTATVTAVTPVTLWSLERSDFLGAITGTGAARVAAEDVVSRRLAT
jgi:predicted MFS family arabinose efflux permease